MENRSSRVRVCRSSWLLLFSSCGIPFWRWFTWSSWLFVFLHTHNVQVSHQFFFFVLRCNLFLRPISELIILLLAWAFFAASSIYFFHDSLRSIWIPKSSTSYFQFMVVSSSVSLLESWFIWSKAFSTSRNSMHVFLLSSMLILVSSYHLVFLPWIRTIRLVWLVVTHFVPLFFWCRLEGLSVSSFAVVFYFIRAFLALI